MRQLPLHALRAFEAAARRGSFKDAAAELHVSPTAISHHIRALEQELGRKLFQRRAGGVVVNEAGTALAEECTLAFRGLREAFDAAGQRSERITLTLAIGPALAARWLSPRLSDLTHALGNIELRVIPITQALAPHEIEADLFVQWGTGEWPDLQTFPLFEIELVPVVSPKIVKNVAETSIEKAVRHHRLLHHRDDQQWSDWLKSIKLSLPSSPQGIRIDDANVLLRCCIEGQGIALGWLPLIEQELASGHLTKLSDHAILSADAYHLCIPMHSSANKDVLRLAEWLRSASSIEASDKVNTHGATILGSPF